MNPSTHQSASIDDGPPWKGGFDRSSWMGRYAEYLMQAGAEHPEAWEWAQAAWEASPDDADPEEAASADIAYSVEDAS